MSDACPKCGHCEPPAIATWTLTIASDIPSQNEIGKGSSVWSYKRKRDELQWLVRAEMRRVGLPKAERKRRIRVTRHYGGHCRERDYGNLVGGAKALVDALVREGVITDDKPAGVDDYYAQGRIASGKTHVTVVVEELP